MKMSEKISIIVPIYNVKQYLTCCLNSLINQTYQNIEILCVDDGSTDGSSDICDKYAEVDSRVRVVHKDNGGASSARKCGVDNSTGNYIMFVDGDDWIDSNTVELCVFYARKFSAECVLFSYAKEYESKSVNVSILERAGNYTENEANFLYRRLFGLVKNELREPENLDHFVPCCMKLYQRKLVEKGRYFDTKYVGSCEDGLFNIYALASCKNYYYINQSLYHYRKTNATSLTTLYRKNFQILWKNLFYEFDQYIKQNNLDLVFSEALNNRIALSMIHLGLNELQNPDKKEIKRNLRKYLADSQYCNAVDRLSTKYMPLKWKIYFYFCKHKKVSGIYFLSKVIRFLKMR